MRYKILLLICLTGVWTAFKSLLLREGLIKKVFLKPNGTFISNPEFNTYRNINRDGLSNVIRVSPSSNSSTHTNISNSMRSNSNIINQEFLNNLPTNANPTNTRTNNLVSSASISQETFNQGLITQYRISDKGAIVLGISISAIIATPPLTIGAILVFNEMFKEVLPVP